LGCATQNRNYSISVVLPKVTKFLSLNLRAREF
jgi:hypothetical protein